MTIYALYIPIFVVFMKKESDFSVFKRYIMPSLAIFGSLFMMFAACFSHGMAVVAYLVIFGVVMLGGVFFSREREF